jgi:hypothetical protein
MTADNKKNFEKVFKLLEETGLLLVSGSEIPDVRHLVAHKGSKGSWWADPAAHEIFAVTELLADHPDVLVTKLISSKVTFVHRKLWPQVFAVASAREEWQMKGLSSAAQLLLGVLADDKALITSELGSAFGPKPGNTARELELRLLIHADQIHTKTGEHAKTIETWGHWAKRVRFKPLPINSARAYRFLEKRVDDLNKKYGGNGQLPWQTRKA